MSAETGRVIDPIDLGDFGDELEPPVFVDLAAGLVRELAPVHAGLERAHGALFAETLLDVFTGDDSDFPAGAGPSSAETADPLPLDDLLAAQSGFEDVRAALAAYEALFPPNLIPGAVVIDRRNPPPGNRGGVPPPRSGGV
jgi:hypothetical protein